MSLKNKERVTVCFFVTSNLAYVSNVLESVYEEFAKDERFNAVIIISPYTYFSADYTRETCEKTENYLKSKGFTFINGYNKETETFVDVKNVLKPEISFFMVPYNYVSPKEFNLEGYMDTLTCYIPYSYMLANNMQSVLNTDAVNYAWKVFRGGPKKSDRVLSYYL